MGLKALSVTFLLLYSRWLYKPDSTWGCVDQTRRW